MKIQNNWGITIRFFGVMEEFGSTLFSSGCTVAKAVSPDALLNCKV
jgi:hypothetical protein